MADETNQAPTKGEAGFDFASFSDDELRELRRATTQELRRRGVLPARKAGRAGRAGGGKRRGKENA